MPRELREPHPWRRSERPEALRPQPPDLHPPSTTGQTPATTHHEQREALEIGAAAIARHEHTGKAALGDGRRKARLRPLPAPPRPALLASRPLGRSSARGPAAARRHGAAAREGFGAEAAHPAAAAKGELSRPAFCLLVTVALRGGGSGHCLLLCLRELRSCHSKFLFLCLAQKSNGSACICRCL